jgi:hypothetical protein
MQSSVDSSGHNRSGYPKPHGDVSFHAPRIIEKDTGQQMRIRATYEVIDWLFGGGQTALRQAITEVAHAVAMTPKANPKLVEAVDRATRAQSPTCRPSTSSLRLPTCPSMV